MSNSLVLILDPLNSPLREVLTICISHLDNIDFHITENISNELSSLPVSPDLVIILLDQCNRGDYIKQKLGDVPRLFPSCPVIIVVNTKDICEGCLECKNLSWGFITAPFNTPDIRFIINWYIKKREEDRAESIESFLKQRSLSDLFIGRSHSVLSIKSKISKVAPYDVTILLQGESGVGKELSAKLIHYLSRRSQRPFIAVNCGAIPNQLFENELFGHKKGAYTDANSNEKGVIGESHTGTLFLDEIESLPLPSQVKLLRFIEEKKYKPLGQTSQISSDVRIIAAANKDLGKLVSSGDFRDDLFYRLSVVSIDISTLKERKDDIPILAHHFINKFSKLYSKKIIGIRPGAMMHMMQYSWPGNIRELENMIQEAVLFNSGGWIAVENLNFTKFGGDDNFTLESFQKSKKQFINDFEENYLKTVLKAFDGNISKASGFAHKDRREFYRLVKKYNIEPNIYRPIK